MDRNRCAADSDKGRNLAGLIIREPFASFLQEGMLQFKFTKGGF
jgi:hypothetical protein